MKYIQSFYQYPVTFSSIGKTIPARSAQGDLRNLAEISEAELEKLQNREPLFRELVEQKKIRVLNHMPESYKTSASRINEANDEIARLKAELEKERAKKAGAPQEEPKEEPEAETKDFDKMTYAELQEAAKAAGIEYKNKKKAELLKQLKATE